MECVAHQFAGLAQGFAGEEELRELRRLRELWIALFTLQLIEVLAERLGRADALYTMSSSTSLFLVLSPVCSSPQKNDYDASALAGDIRRRLITII